MGGRHEDLEFIVGTDFQYLYQRVVGNDNNIMGCGFVFDKIDRYPATALHDTYNPPFFGTVRLPGTE